MPNENPRLNDKTVRIGLMSRIDFGSDGFRQGLLELAAETFKTEDVAFVVLAGGLVSGRVVAEKTSALKKRLKELQRQIKAKDKELQYEEDAKKAKLLQTAISKLARERSKVEDALEELTPEKMAATLAKSLPRFTDARGKPVKLYIIPSPAYDKAVGEKTATLLADLEDREELRLLKSGGDRLPLWEDTPKMRNLEVLTLDKQTWLRGDYHSTPVQRRIKDKRRQTSSSEQVDLQVVGGVGVSILKPEGNWPIGFVAVPALHRLEETGVAESQVGVQVLEVECDRRNATLRSHSFKDLISRERGFIGAPSDLSPARLKCIDVLKKHGRCSTGRIAERTGLSKDTVHKTLRDLLATKDNKRYKTWPGLVYDALADRWDFELTWVQRFLRYRLPEGERKTDVFVAICCMHAGSLDTDYTHFLEDVPKVMLEQGATMLVSAGDHVEGTSHDLLMKGEIVAGADNTEQEELAADMISTVLFEVFKVRFDAAQKASAPKGPEEVAALVRSTLPKFRYVPGNHCGWISRSGVRPLATMVSRIWTNLTGWLDAHLASKKLGIPGSLDLVKDHIETVGDGRFLLPSGMPMGMTHPHMGGSETISSSAQKALNLYRDCPVVIIGNFHTGVLVEEWEAKLGQRACIQVGTMKHGSPFEHSKLKTVDQGFAAAKIVSINGRIVCTVTTFYSNDKVQPGSRRVDRRKPLADFRKSIGLVR